MRRRISLRRLGLLFSLGLGIGLCGIVAGVLILNARNAARDEVNTAFGLATAYLDEFRGRMQIGPQPMEEALAFARQIDLMRHVRAEVRGPDGHLLSPRGPELEPEIVPPAWFARLLQPEPRQAAAHITRYPNTLGTLIVFTDYRDETAEAWSDFRSVLMVIFGVSVAAAGAIFLILHLIHRRLEGCNAVLETIRAGDFSAAPPPRRIAELDDLATGIRALAADLGARESENQRLQRRLMTLSDSERRQVASDLHDGLGPLLFALGTAVSEAGAIAGRGDPAERAALLDELEAVATHARALRGMVRGVIYRLRPMIEADASLGDLLVEFAAGFAEVAPEAEVRLELDGGAETTRAGSAGLAVLRFAQESALNAVRHGGADEIIVRATTDADPEGEDWIHVELSDNGRGPAAGAAPSYGQAGILDRARALGGAYQRPERRGGVTRTRLSLPLRDERCGLDAMSAA